MEDECPVDFDGQVLSLHPKMYGAYIFDGTQGIYLETRNMESFLQDIRIGDWVRVRGTAETGGFSHHVVIKSLERIGNRPLPAASAFQLNEMELATVDCDWVMIQGRLVSMEVDAQYNAIFLGMEIAGYEAEVEVVNHAGAVEYLSGLMYNKVQLNAVAGMLFNSERQMVKRKFFTSDFSSIVPTDPDAFEQPAIPLAIHELQRAGSDYSKKVKTVGWVTYAENGELYLRGEKTALKVQVLDSRSIHVGDYVEIEGFVWPQRISPGLRGTAVKVIEHKGAPGAIAINPQGPLSAPLNNELVTLDVTLVDLGKSFGLASEDASAVDRINLLCRNEDYLFEARLPAGTDLVDMEPGSRLRLTGICQLKLNPERREVIDFQSFWMLLRSGNDVELLQPAPWWTTTRLRWVLSMLMGGLLLAVLWGLLLRKTVAKQTGIIQQKIAQEVVHDERQRIARELHDNLAQGLAGIALQIKGCRKLVEFSANRRMKWLDKMMASVREESLPFSGELETERVAAASDEKRFDQSLSVMQQTLSYCSAEARNSIMDLRGGLLERMNLPEAFREVLQPLAEECGALLNLTVTGKVRPLEQRVERNLLLIAKEAATNAVRHASPEFIHAKLSYEEDAVTFFLRDDGCGFDANVLPPAGHFGVRGMKERCKKIGGSFELISEPGRGTEVCVRLLISDGADRDGS
ncbi:histidine kinase [Pontiella agarivorans]|uniref:Histidine kinase n=1 Tax=Pontiella agarivorans TaxID=3038953 RepID=A0ABU5MU42_9BACT|nr:histidine kinase [Pontiella agarivorans]MDZ8117708.1 histidine kinase [Pontiella agarivorans]